MIVPDRLGSSTVYKGTFKDAQRVATAEVKFLCVLILCSDHPSCSESYLRHMFGYSNNNDNKTANNNFVADDAELDEILSTRCVIWAADIDDEEADRLCGSNTSWVPATFPFFGVTFKNNIVMDLQGNFTSAELKKELLQCFRECESTVAREIAFAADRNAREAERSYEDKQMQAMMEQDARRQQEKKDAEEAKRRKEAEEDARLQRLLQEAERRKEEEARAKAEAEQRKALAMSNVPEVPPKETTPADQMATIRLTTLSGQNETRLFYRSTPLSGLYCYAESLPDYDGTQVYELVAGFPPRRIDNTSEVTIGETPVLLPRCVVTMKKVVGASPPSSPGMGPTSVS